MSMKIQTDKDDIIRHVQIVGNLDISFNSEMLIGLKISSQAELIQKIKEIESTITKESMKEIIVTNEELTTWVNT